jgi:soluble lytic murein transglycosylase-like protein
MDARTPKEQRPLTNCAKTTASLAFLAAVTIAPVYTSSSAIPFQEAAAAEVELPAAEPERAPAIEADGLIEYLSRRYRIDRGAAADLVGVARDAGNQVGLDPLLILAVIAIESRFNPIAESVAGAKGLMQIVPELHQEKLRVLGGARAVLDPVANIHAGARILSEYIEREGNLEAGLQFYNGAAADLGARYAKKVLAEQERMRMELQVDLRPARPKARAGGLPV